MTSTRCGPPVIGGCAFIQPTWALTRAAQPTGCAVVQMKPRIRGLMIIAVVGGARRQIKTTRPRSWRSVVQAACDRIDKPIQSYYDALDPLDGTSRLTR